MSDIRARVSEIDTPALLIDLDLLEKNIETMASFLGVKRKRITALISSVQKALSSLGKRSELELMV